MKFLRLLSLVLLAASAPDRACAAPEKTLYHNDFEAAEVGKVPAEMLVMAGDFAVQIGRAHV